MERRPIFQHDCVRTNDLPDERCGQTDHQSTHDSSESTWVIRLDKVSTENLFDDPNTADAETQTDYSVDAVQYSNHVTDALYSVDGNISTRNDGAGYKRRFLQDACTMTESIDNKDASCQTNRKDIPKPNTSLCDTSLSTPRAFNVSDGTENHVDCYISGIAVIDKSKVIVADFNQGKLKLLNERLQLKCSFDTKTKPVSVCRILNNKLAVAFMSRRVSIYDVNESITFYRRFNLRHHCRSACETKNGEIALLLSILPITDKSGNINKIDSDNGVIYIEFRDPLNGRVLREIGDFRYNVKSPTCIVQDTLGRIVVGEITLATAVNHKGVNDWYYISHAKAKLDGVSGLAVDPEGNLYICGNKSNNIHQVSCRNYKNNRVILPFISSPRSVAYDPYHSRLIVGCDNSACLYVYPFDLMDA